MISNEKEEYPENIKAAATHRRNEEVVERRDYSEYREKIEKRLH